MSHRPQPRLPVGPLLALAQPCVVGSQEGGGVAELARCCGVSKRELQRARHRGLSVTLADRCAVALGHHVSEIWPEWFDLAEVGVRAS